MQRTQAVVRDTFAIDFIAIRAGMTAKHRQSDSSSTPPSGASGRVIPFRPRTSDHPPYPSPANDGGEEPAEKDADDFRHRMLANLAAFVFLAGLTGAGIWLAVSVSDLRRSQDCVLVGRTNCAPIASPPR